MTKAQQEKLTRARRSLEEVKSTGESLRRLEFILRSIDEVLEEDLKGPSGVIESEMVH